MKFSNRYNRSITRSIQSSLIYISLRLILSVFFLLCNSFINRLTLFSNYSETQPHNIPFTLKSQRGNALLIVSFLCTVMLLLLGTAIGLWVFAEQQSVERNLVTWQSYWAMRGSLSYALSRAHYTSIYEGGLCSGSCTNDGERANAVNSFIAEISQPNSRNIMWGFPGYDALAPYSFSTESLVVSGGNQTNNGFLQFETSISSTTSQPAMDQILQTPHLLVDFCLNVLSGCGSDLAEIPNDTLGFSKVINSSYFPQAP